MFCIQNAVVDKDMPTQKALNLGTASGDHTVFEISAMPGWEIEWRLSPSNQIRRNLRRCP